MLKRLVSYGIVLASCFSVAVAQGTSAASPHMMITAVQTRSYDSAYEELIEVTNTASTAVDITDWCVKYSATNGETFLRTVCFGAEESGSEHRILINGSSTLLLSSTVYNTNNPEFIGHYQFSGGMSDTGGRVALFDGNGEVVDVVAWGLSNETAEGGIPAPAINRTNPTEQLRRITLEDGTPQDTDVNGDDFMLATALSEYVFTPMVDVLDYCLNISYFQFTVPDGLSRSVSTGECFGVDDTTNEEMPVDDEGGVVNECDGLILSEIGANIEDQFIEVYNSLDVPINPAGCKIMTNRSSTRAHVFGNVIIPSHTFKVIAVSDTDLLLTKTTAGTVYVLSSDDTERTNQHYENLRYGTSWSWFGENSWRQTYDVTPGTENRYAEFAPCDAGYERNVETMRCNKIEKEVTSELRPCAIGQERNPTTNRCRSVTTVTTLVACAPGQTRNPATNRCRSMSSSTTLKPCAPGQTRNPTTNRCRSSASTTSASLKPCAPDQERNPATNRCRMKQEQIPDALYGVKPAEGNTTKTFASWAALVGIATLAVGYGVWEWRQEIAKIIRRGVGK